MKALRSFNWRCGCFRHHGIISPRPPPPLHCSLTRAKAGLLRRSDKRPCSNGSQSHRRTRDIANQFYGKKSEFIQENGRYGSSLPPDAGENKLAHVIPQ
ncbi:hypothetical protein AOLI_G00074310 [Acnodon oligacanthus]